tara:strand:- start:3778 stop:4476 length:699 start_codon:yes stop_codon:yes gene_type:complete
MNKLTVIVPFYNEQDLLLKSVSRLNEQNIADNILLIDDSSSDNSYQIAESIQSQNPHIKLLKTKKNLGKGGAIKLGIENTESDYIIVHDADLEYDPKNIKTALDLAKEQNQEKIVILGSRFIGNIKRKNLYRRTFIANKFLSFLFSIFSGTNVSDVATCYKLISKNIYKNIEITKNGFEFEVEILSKSLKLADRYLEIPINYEGRSYKDGKKIKFSDGFKYIYAIISLNYKK